jgi:putative addiction module CopG family antidote
MSDLIPADLQFFVEAELAAGRYRSQQEVVEAGLRLLKRERDEATEGVRAGLADFNAGRFQTLADTFADLRRDSMGHEGT